MFVCPQGEGGISGPRSFLRGRYLWSQILSGEGVGIQGVGILRGVGIQEGKHPSPGTDI